MNKLSFKFAITLLVVVIIFPIAGFTQEKNVRIKTVKEVNGEKIITDTVFSISEGEAEGDILKKFNWVTDDGDSTNTIMIDVDVDTDFDKEGNEKVIIVKKGYHDKHGKGDCKEHRIKIISDEGGDENVFFFSNDIDMDIDEAHFAEMRIKLKEHGEHLKDLKIEMDGENVFILEDIEGIEKLIELKELEGLEKLHHLENIQMVSPGFHHMPENHDVWLDYHNHSDRVSEKELRDAGIKVKADRLKMGDMDINIDNGVVDLEFVLVEEGAPKVSVFNFYGDKVYNGKPELMNGKYVIKIDLSSKQHGTYYLQVVQKNSSLTKKLKI